MFLMATRRSCCHVRRGWSVPVGLVGSRQLMSNVRVGQLLVRVRVRLLHLQEWLKERLRLRTHGPLFVDFPNREATERQGNALIQLIEDARKRGRREPAMVYNKALHCFVRTGDFERSRTVFEALQADGLTPSRLTFNTYIKVCHGRFQLAEQLYIDMRGMGLEPNIQTYTKIMSLYADVRRWRDCIRWFNRMEKEARFEPDYIAYNTVLRAYSSTSLPQARLWLDLMRRRRVTITTYAYNIMIELSGQAGRLAMAETYFRELRSSPRAADSNSFHALMKAYTLAGEPQKVEALLLQMIDEGIAPMANCFVQVIRAYAEAKQADKAVEWFVRLEKSHFIIQQAPYLDLIRAHLDNPPVAKLWFDRMRAHGFTESLAHATLMLMEATLRSNDLAGPSTLLDQLKKDDVDVTFAYAAVIQHAGQSLTSACHWYGLAVSDAAVPLLSSCPIHCAMLNVYVRHDRRKEAQQLVALCRKSNVHTTYMYNMLIRLDDKNPALAARWFNEIQQAGLVPDAHSFRAVLRAYAMAGDQEQACFYFEQMRASNFAPEEMTYYSMLLAHRHHPKKALAWFSRMTQDGFRPKVSSVNAVIKAFATAGDIQACNVWLQRMPKLGAEPNNKTFVNMVEVYARAVIAAPSVPMAPKLLAAAEDWLTRYVETSARNNTLCQRHPFQLLSQAYAACGIKGKARSCSEQYWRLQRQGRKKARWKVKTRPSPGGKDSTKGARQTAPAVVCGRVTGLAVESS